MNNQHHAPRNRTIRLTDEERQRFSQSLCSIHAHITLSDMLDTTIHQDSFSVLPFLPADVFDLVVADPPYNLTKTFNTHTFKQTSLDDYENWLHTWLPDIRRVLKPTGSVYICGDWRSSTAIHRALLHYFIVRNRITWEREKGRGAKNNWKNNMEDIWYATVSDRYVFNVEDVKLKRRVIAPYTNQHGQPKDWEEQTGCKFRTTHPANIWTDLSVPFWSMPENTEHPTQKPEKLLAKIILASSTCGDVVFDPFVGSGTTSVVAKKLARHYVGIEIDHEYCCLTEKRLELADVDRSIQGYKEGVFWERNTLAQQNKEMG